jgi:hypothetical protein
MALDKGNFPYSRRDFPKSPLSKFLTARPASGRPVAMPKKFTVMQSLPELLKSYDDAPLIRCNKTGKPDPNGWYIRLAGGGISRLLLEREAAHGRKRRRSKSRWRADWELRNVR